MIFIRLFIEFEPMISELCFLECVYVDLSPDFEF